MARVTGIGGIFFRCKDSDAQRNWYQSHLGLNTDEYGTTFEWRQSENPEIKGFSQWSPFKQDTDYFEGEFMINYRVDNLDEMLAELKAKGVELVGEVMVESYGKFAHIRDPEGHRVELWEPNDAEYEKLIGVKTV